MSGLQKSPISARAFEILPVYWRGLEPNEKIPDRAINSALQPVLLGLRRTETADPPCVKQVTLRERGRFPLSMEELTQLHYIYVRFSSLPLSLTDRVSREFMLSFFRKWG